MKKVLVTIDILMIIATVLPAAWLLWQCFETAINGTYPMGFTYGFDYHQMIYGAEAFCYTMMFYCYFLFFLVIPWVTLFFVTLIFTGLTISYVKRKPVAAKNR